MNSNFLLRLFCLFPTLLTFSTDFTFAETREEALKRLNKRIATVTAVSSVQKSLADVTALEDAFQKHLAAEIMASPREHRELERSRQLGRTVSIENFIADRINSAITAVLQTQPNVTRPELMAALPPGIRTAAVTAVAEKLFDHVFENARREAVSQQFQKLKTQIKPPTFEDINKRLNQNRVWNSHVVEIRTAIKKSTSIAPELTLEENTTAIDRLIRECLDRIEAELDTQNRLVQTVTETDLPENALFEDEIRTAASAQLESTLKRQDSRYPVFDTVRKRLEQRARDLETDRYARFIKGAEITFPTGDELRTCITATPAQHHELKASLQALTTLFRESTAKKFAEQYVRQIPNPPATADSRLADLCSRKPIQEAVDQRLKSQLTQTAATVRKAISKEQMQRHFGDLASLKPSEAQIEARYDSRTALDFAGATQIIGGKPPEPETLLAETVTQVIRTVNDTLQSQVSKLQSQLSALSTMERELADDLLLDIAADVPKEEITDKWKNSLTKKVSSPTLFARTEKELNKTVSQHYTATKQKLEERQAMRGSAASTTKSNVAKQEQQSAAEQSRASNSNAASDGNAGSGSAGGAGNGGVAGGTMPAAEEGGNPEFVGEGPPPHGTITFSPDPSGRVTATADFSKITVTFDPVAIQTSAQELTQAFAEPLKTLRANTPPEKPGDPLRIAIVIGTDDLRHRMSILFRTAVSQRLGCPVVWADAARR